MIVSFPTGKDISIEINGKRLAVAQSYKVKASKESRYIESLGSEEPVGTVGGRSRYLLELTRVAATDTALADGIDFYSLSDFNVVVAGPDKRVIFSGCEWSDIVESSSVGDVIMESVAIIASKRMQI